jgi:hypothetical protein
MTRKLANKSFLSAKAIIPTCREDAIWKNHFSSGHNFPLKFQKAPFKSTKSPENLYAAEKLLDCEF